MAEERTEANRCVTVSVRSLVEFILRSGDLESGSMVGSSVESMQMGSKIHRKLQRLGGSDYQAEVSMKIEVPFEREEFPFTLSVEGRADGIFERDDRTWIDEIKGVYRELYTIEEPDPLHRAQVMCYAYIYARDKELDKIGIRLTYCHIPTEEIKYFHEEFTFSELKGWFDSLTAEYGKWAYWQLRWNETRNASIKNLVFPYDYRPGQRELAQGVYRTILRKKKLFIEAPTGVGKTISTVFPAVKAMGEGITEKLFYLTAKTSTRTVAEQAFRLLEEQGADLKVITLTAKDKVCVLEKPDCNPGTCERAKGHYDRVNDAIYDMLTHENAISRDSVLQYAEKHMVCPFEMCLDVSLFSDAVICDYNYVFDPVVYLRRFFAGEKKNDYVFLIDEAHNLVERAREMFSEELYKEDFLAVKRIMKMKSKKMTKALELCNADLLGMKRECEEFEEISSIGDLIFHLMNLAAVYEEYLRDNPAFPEREEIIQLYFNIRHFLAIYEIMDEKYVIYTDYDEDGRFHLKLQCMDPSRNLSEVLNRGRSAVFFSATLLPIHYYKEQLSGTEEDYAVYAPSPFDPNRRLVMVGADVTSRYSRRSAQEYGKFAEYIHKFAQARLGNYMVFFPSYQLMNEVYELMEDNAEFEILLQHSNMTETEKEEFLEAFETQPTKTKIGFCVMGGIFGEGIDLREDRLIGAVIIGTGLPMVCNERELFRKYFDRNGKAGFDYSYLYNGMNKVLQSAGRVIRTMDDRGAVLLLDERFLNRQYQELFPREWFPYQQVNRQSIGQVLHSFWSQ
ncbi:ATP-dependent DNA helicase [Anaerolentibacter hominis]|uniref:ATP-dependent DNA helicase n=1 Tax=Anaerolentibacter hominis TaxID=3079009 RepID=UPI0031B86383